MPVAKLRENSSVIAKFAPIEQRASNGQTRTRIDWGNIHPHITHIKGPQDRLKKKPHRALADSAKFPVAEIQNYSSISRFWIHKGKHKQALRSLSWQNWTQQLRRVYGRLYRWSYIVITQAATPCTRWYDINGVMHSGLRKTYSRHNTGHHNKIPHWFRLNCWNTAKADTKHTICDFRLCWSKSGQFGFVGDRSPKIACYLHISFFCPCPSSV